MSEENTNVVSEEAANSEEDQMSALEAKLNAVIAGAPAAGAPTAAAASSEPKQLQFKTRKIYNFGSKAAPRFVVTFGAVVYGQPDGFVPVGDRVDLASADDPEFLVDRNGGIWLAEGENSGCGPRCPVSLRYQPLNQIVNQLGNKVTADTTSALMLCVQAQGPAIALSKVWRGLSHTQRTDILKVLVPAAAK